MAIITPSMHIVIDDVFDHLIPAHDGEELGRLSKSIQDEGVLEPILLWERGDEYLIVDGHTRYRIATEFGKDIPYVTKEFADDIAVRRYMIDIQLRRRNLSKVAKQALGVEVSRLDEAEARVHQRAGVKVDDDNKVGRSIASAVERMNDPDVTVNGVTTMKVVIDHGIDAVVDAVINSKLSPTTAADVARLPEEDQVTIMKDAIRDDGKVDKHAVRAGLKDAQRKLHVEQVAVLAGVADPGDEEVARRFKHWYGEVVGERSKHFVSEFSPDQVIIDRVLNMKGIHDLPGSDAYKDAVEHIKHDMADRIRYVEQLNKQLAEVDERVAKDAALTVSMIADEQVRKLEYNRQVKELKDEEAKRFEALWNVPRPIRDAMVAGKVKHLDVEFILDEDPKLLPTLAPEQVTTTADNMRADKREADFERKLKAVQDRKDVKEAQEGAKALIVEVDHVKLARIHGLRMLRTLTMSGELTCPEHGGLHGEGVCPVECPFHLIQVGLDSLLRTPDGEDSKRYMTTIDMLVDQATDVANDPALKPSKRERFVDDLTEESYVDGLYLSTRVVEGKRLVTTVIDSGKVSRQHEPVPFKPIAAGSV